MKYLVFPFCFLSLCAVASESDHYVSFGVSDGHTAFYSSEFNPNIGYQYVSENTHRWSISASHGVDSNYSTLVGGYDYLYDLNDRWALLAGVTTGVAFSSGYEDGALAGARIGALYEPVSNLKLEFGYRAQDTVSNWKDRDMSRIESLYIGVNMKV